MMAAIRERLLSLRDPEYQKFQQKLIPNLEPAQILGVRTPQLRALAKEIGEGTLFLQQLPHQYFEENQLHAFLLENHKDFSQVISMVDSFLPYIDNWATCDQLRPEVFAKHREELLPYIRKWLASSQPYTIRYGIEMLMVHFLEDNFRPEYPQMVAAVSYEDYYVKMMVAWYFATALAKQYDAVLPFITEYRLEKWTHNKTIQKAIESYRIPAEQKTLLKSYRLK